MTKSHEGHQDRSQSDFFSLVDNKSSVLQTLIPENLYSVITVHKLWADHPPVLVYVADMVNNRAVVVNREENSIISRSEFDAFPEYMSGRGKKMNAVVILSPGFPPDSPLTAEISNLLQKANKMLRPGGLLYLAEKSEQPSNPVFRKDMLKLTGFLAGKTDFILVEEDILLWTSQKRAARPPQKPLMEGKENFPDWVNRMLEGLRIHYLNLEFSIVDETAIRKIIMDKGAYSVLTALRNYGGVRVQAPDGCSWDMPVNGDPGIPVGILCEDHQVVRPPNINPEGFNPDSRLSRRIATALPYMEMTPLDLTRQDTIGYRCRLGCSGELVTDSRIESVLPDGYIVSVDIICPNHGLHARYEVKTDGSSPHDQRIIRIISEYVPE